MENRIGAADGRAAAAPIGKGEMVLGVIGLYDAMEGAARERDERLNRWSYETAERTLCWVMDHCGSVYDNCDECPIYGNDRNLDCARYLIDRISGLDRESARNVAGGTGAFQCFGVRLHQRRPEPMALPVMRREGRCLIETDQRTGRKMNAD